MPPAPLRGVRVCFQLLYKIPQLRRKCRFSQTTWACDLDWTGCWDAKCRITQWAHDRLFDLRLARLAFSTWIIRWSISGGVLDVVCRLAGWCTWSLFGCWARRWNGPPTLPSVELSLDFRCTHSMVPSDSIVCKHAIVIVHGVEFRQIVGR